ncbi:MAG: hypothetical protein ACP5K2_07805 [bacterium]
MKRQVRRFLDIDDKKSITSMKIFFLVIFGLSILVVVSSIGHLLSLK